MGIKNRHTNVMKKAFAFISTFLVFSVIIYFLHPSNYLKSNVKGRIALSFSISLFYNISFLLQYLLLKSKKINKSFIFYLYNIFFLFANTLTVFIIAYIFHPNLFSNTYNKILLTVLSFSILLQLIFVLIFKMIQYKKRTIKNHNKPFHFYDNNNTIVIRSEDLYYIKSSGNYIEIVEKNNLKGHILRSSLKEIEQKYSQLYRCHKSYLVNLDNIKSISGNSKGYELTFYDNNIGKIPVARDKGEFIKGRLT